LEDSSPESRNSCRNGGEGRIGTNTCRRDNSVQEAKDRLEQDAIEKKGGIQEIHLGREEEQHTGTTSTRETGKIGSKQQHIQY